MRPPLIAPSHCHFREPMVRLRQLAPKGAIQALDQSHRARASAVEEYFVRGPHQSGPGAGHFPVCRDLLRVQLRRCECGRLGLMCAGFRSIANVLVVVVISLQLVKRDPGVLGIRCWSQYGMLYMRHFNELDHELQARLNRAYRPSVKYMESFSSPMGAVIAR